MITVNVYDLLVRAAEIISDGYSEVALDILDGPSASLFVEAVIDEHETVFFDSVPQSSSKSGHFNASEDSIAPHAITFGELVLTANAFHNAIENCLTCLEDKEIPDEIKKQIVDDKKRYEIYLSKLESFLSKYMNKC